MAASTKKAGSAGRFGARYGGLARKKVATIERVQRAKHECPSCGADKVRRSSTGIWTCRKCDHTFAGGAYTPQTGAGRGAKKTLRGINDKLVRGEQTAASDEALEALAAEEGVETEDVVDEDTEDAAAATEASEEQE